MRFTIYCTSTSIYLLDFNGRHVVLINVYESDEPMILVDQSQRKHLRHSICRKSYEQFHFKNSIFVSIILSNNFYLDFGFIKFNFKF